MWEVILDALKDSAIALPFLLLIYLFIEFLEHNKRAKDKTVQLLNGRLAPLVAGGVGIVPQCGFSVMATDLYCQNYIKIGTLIAFFVATSDEALPILLTNGKTVGVVWLVLLIKIVYAVLLGYLLNLLDRKLLSANYTLTETGCCHHELAEQHASETQVEVNAEPAQMEDESHENAQHEHKDAALHEHGQEPEREHESGHHHGHTDTSRAKTFWNFVKHPILHTLKIFAYIFVVNAIFGMLLFYAEQPIMDFVADFGFLQTFVTAAIGLIPNCASSVIISGMYADGIIGLSAMIAGLVSNSGIALAILFKQKKFKRNFGILGIMYLAGVVLGVVCYFVFPLTPLATH